MKTIKIKNMQYAIIKDPKKNIFFMINWKHDPDIQPNGQRLTGVKYDSIAGELLANASIFNIDEYDSLIVNSGEKDYEITYKLIYDSEKENLELKRQNLPGLGRGLIGPTEEQIIIE